MSSSSFNRHFSRLKFYLTTIAILIWLWVSCVLFIRSCGGPFPERTRGPFADEEYYRLGNLPAWESMVEEPYDENRTFSEAFQAGETLPVLPFGTPTPPEEDDEAASLPEVSDAPESATPEAATPE